MTRLGALGARFAKIVLVLVMLIGALAVTEQSVRAGTPDADFPRGGELPCAMNRTGEYGEADPTAAGLDPAKLQVALVSSSAC